MTATARKYNPGFLSDDELVESFCVRTAEFDSAIEMLRECDGPANPHRILIGPRGSGKTSLLLRVAAEIRRDDDLSRRFYPVVFAEESYDVSTAGEFWLECLSRLADRAPTGEDASDLRRTVEDLRTIRDDRTLGDRCLGTLLDVSDRVGRRLVVMVENLNSMFGEMADGDAGWRLRQTLQTEPRILLLASATSRFDEIDNPDCALYDLFRIVALPPLDNDECAVLWEQASGRRRDPGNIRPLQILTGGSPRLIAILGRFGAALSFRELMEEVLEVVDDHTEYFRSHLEVLPAQERRVYLALADLWKPATTREIADRARLDTSKCSAQLNRLIERGAVEVAGGGARRKQYYLAERLYNIYYLMRRSRGPEPMVEALVRFMEAFYSPDELADFGVRLAGEDTLDAEADSLRRRALEHLMESSKLATFRGELLGGIPGDPAKDLPQGAGLSKAVGAAAIGATLSIEVRESIEVSAKTTEGREAARTLLDEAVALNDESRSEDALALCDEAIGRFGDADAAEVLESVASALVLKGDILAGFNRLENAWTSFAEAVRGVRDRSANVLSDFLSMALTGKEAGLNRAPEALAAYDEVLSRFGTSDVPAVMNQVGRALIHKGTALLALDRTDEALAALDEAISRFGQSDVPSLVETAAGAFCMKGFMLSVRDRGDDALAALDEAVRRCRENDAPEAFQQLAVAFFLRGLALVPLGRTDEALSAWDEAVGFFARTETPIFLEMAAVTLVQKATSLAGLERLEDSLDAWHGAVQRYDAIESPAFPEIAATALVNRAYMLGRLDRIEEALADCNEFMRRYGKENAPAFQELSANALFCKGDLFEKSNRHDEALAVFDDLVDRFGSGDRPGILEPVAKSLFRKAEILERLGQPEEALSLLDEVVRRFAESDTSVLVEWAAKALLRKGQTLHKLVRLEDALAANDEVVRRFGDRNAPEFVGPVSAALLAQGFMFYEANRPAEALCVFDEAIRRFSENDASDAFGMFAFARLGQGQALRELDRPEEALGAFEMAVALLGQSGHDWLRKTISPALIDKAALELTCERFWAAVETAGRALDPSLMPSPENRLRGHMIRAKATLAVGDTSSCKQDIESFLAILPELGSFPSGAVEMLMSLSVELGPAEMHPLVQTSPAASLLLPLKTALEWELGMESRVAREVEEVARDIRKAWQQE